MRWARTGLLGARAPGASRWLLAASAAVFVVWLQAHLLLAGLRDDGTTVRNAIAVYNSPEARAQIDGAITWAFHQGAELTNADEDLMPIRDALAAAIDAGRFDGEVSEALVQMLLAVRDDALEQFDTSAPARPLTVPLRPLLAVFEIPVTAELLSTLGDAEGEIAMPVVSAEGMATLRTRYGWTVTIDTWGLAVAGVLAIAGVLVSPRPLRTGAIAFGIGGAACLLAIPLFAAVQSWLAAGGIGAWSPLLAPLVSGAIDQVRPWLVPVGSVALAVGVGSFVAVMALESRAAESGPTPDSAG